MNWILVPILVSSSYASQEPQEPSKPVCTAEIRGQVWPAKADRKPGYVLELCTRRRWHYGWEPITVSLSQLAQQKRRLAFLRP